MSRGGSPFVWLRHLLRNLARSRRADADLSRDVEAWADLLIEEKIERGLSPREARRQALVEIEGLEATKEKTRAVRAGTWLTEAARDVRYALRAARTSPGFTMAAVLTLGLGIGANTAVFSVVDGVLLRDLPYADADRLVIVQNHDPESEFGFSERERLLYRTESSIFESFATWQFGSGNLTGDGDAERLIVGIVDPNLLETLGVVPIRGRSFVETDIGGGPTTVAILTHEFWTRRHAADEAVLGRTIMLNGRGRQVIGILPAGFRLPGDFVGDPVALYVPQDLTGQPDPENIHYLTAVARLVPGLGLDEAGARARAVAARVGAQIPQLPDAYSVRLEPIAERVLGDVTPGLTAVAAAVVLLLLVSCGNLASLLLARSRTRRSEIALRCALGAGRSRIIRQLLTESVLLAALGGLLGVALAAAGTRLLVALGPNLPRLDAIALDGRVLLFTLALSVATGLLFGLLPALTQARDGLQTEVAGSARGASGAGSRLPARRLLVAAQVALSVALAIGAGLVLRSASQLAAVPPGFEPEGVLTSRLTLPAASYPDHGATRAFYGDLLDSVLGLPGVRAAGLTTHLPLANTTGDWGLMIDGLPERLDNGRRPDADWQVVSEGYFEAMGIPVVEGRAFTAADRDGTQLVTIINQRMAREYWPDRSPIGVRMQMSSTIDPVYRTIVGVVGDVRHGGVDQVADRQMFLPLRQFPQGSVGPFRSLSLVVRADGDPALLSGPVRGRVAALDANVPVSLQRTMADVLQASTSATRVYVILLGVFAAIALAIVCVGIYSVSAYLVATRRRELAVRRALGASTGSVIRLVLGESAASTALGLAIGLAASAVLAGAMAELLFGVGARDPLTFALVPVVIALTALAANVIPARRAASQDALRALRLD